MNLEYALNNPIKSWIYAERFVNEGSPSGYSQVNQVSLPAHPVFGQPFFQVGCFECSMANVHYLVSKGAHEKEPPYPLKTGYIPIHPDMVTHESTKSLGLSNPPKDLLTCIPSSSGRTVFVWSPDNEEPLYFLKLHYGNLLGRFNRTLDRRRIISALKINSDLVESQEYFPSGIAFLPEVGAFLAQNNLVKTSEVGALIRSLHPFPYSIKNEVFIPFFALFSKDIKRSQEPILLEQVLRWTSDPYQTFLERLIEPLLQGFCFLALHLGLIPEWNAQNLLLGMTSEGHITRIVFRDLQGTYRDLAYRASFLPEVDEDEYKILPCKTSQHCFEARRQRSYLFDFKLCQYVLEPLANLTAKILGLSKYNLEQKIVEITMKEFSKYCDYDTYFPEGNVWYGQSSGISEKNSNFFSKRLNPTFRLYK